MIDEKKLLEAIKKYHEGLKPKYVSKLVDAEILDIIDIIKEQPKISLENKTSDKWIPVEEALPEAYLYVIVTYVYDGRNYVTTAFYCNDGKWCTDIQHSFNVIAWQLLPPKYEG